MVFEKVSKESIVGGRVRRLLETWDAADCATVVACAQSVHERLSASLPGAKIAKSRAAPSHAGIVVDGHVAVQVVVGGKSAAAVIAGMEGLVADRRFDTVFLVVCGRTDPATRQALSAWCDAKSDECDYERNFSALFNGPQLAQ